MDLYMWLAKHRMTKSEFAKKIKASRIHLYRIMEGYAVSNELLVRIEEETGGQVTRCDINPKFKKRKKKSKEPNVIQLDAFK